MDDSTKMGYSDGECDRDIELKCIEAAKNGDDAAFRQLADNCYRMLYGYVYSLSVPASDREDLIQEGLVGLLKAVRSYDGVSSSFATYASVCVKNSITTALRKYKKGLEYVSTEDVEEGTGVKIPTAPSPEMVFIKRESTKLLYQKAFSVLSDFEATAFEKYLQSYSYSEIAEITGRTVKSVDNAIQRARRKIAAIL